MVPGLFAAAITMLLTPAVARLAVRLEAVDVPGGRRKHSRSTPRLGGIAIVAGIALSLGPSLVMLMGSRPRSLSLKEILWFTVAVLVIFILGLVDDIFGLGPSKKLVFQTLAASIVVYEMQRVASST